MRQFDEFEPWFDALLDDHDEESYRAIFDLYCAINTLQRGSQDPFSQHHEIQCCDRPDGERDYHFIDRHYQTTLIVQKQTGLRDLHNYLVQRLQIEPDTTEGWVAWSDRQHEYCREDRSDWV